MEAHTRFCFCITRNSDALASDCVGFGGALMLLAVLSLGIVTVPALYADDGVSLPGMIVACVASFAASISLCAFAIYMIVTGARMHSAHDYTAKRASNDIVKMVVDTMIVEGGSTDDTASDTASDDTTCSDADISGGDVSDSV